MSEAEKQEGQKTVVAFITGLLIGGLLVWVFSSSPDAAPVTSSEEAGTEEVSETDSETTTETEEEAVTETKTETVSQRVEVGEGMLTVANQPAGATVALTDTKFPTSEGWIVVRDYNNGVGTGVLGAARYDIEEGLIPTSVELQRATETGKTYQVVFFTQGGDKKFSLADDKLIEDIAATFTAQ